MRKVIVFGCSALLSLMATGVYAGYTIPTTTVGDFLKFCANNQADCGTEITAVLVMDAANSPPSHVCEPPTTKNEDIEPAVLKWLSDHQESSNMETDNGIYLALQKLYPCK